MSGDITLNVYEHEPPSDEAPDESELEEEEQTTQKKKKKKKSSEPSPEQVLENHFIETLEKKYGSCDDDDCNLPRCFVADDGNHANLTPLHLRVWAGALASNLPGSTATIQLPPKIYPFVQSGHTQDIDDVLRLAGCRAAQLQQPQASNITFSLAGLADIIHAPLQPVINPGNTSTSSPPRLLQPKMALMDFCDKYNLSSDIFDKLFGADITGPHALCYITTNELESVVKLTLGEPCDVMDALDRFKRNMD
ncbi:hypothetical protein BDP27DRAFT_1371361 [Rhodocollybia butyracea]|uniref:Uncharacterized protein n=1 Tax=Rhodocollybia butyracea TaxID=206335 RepID=A0A9P5TXK6_9AGAR|nr:hypothetical protein BDP27DRAFT_1371361 [Rhodocollybia butyracea]